MLHGNITHACLTNRPSHEFINLAPTSSGPHSRESGSPAYVSAQRTYKAFNALTRDGQGSRFYGNEGIERAKDERKLTT